MFEMRPHFPLPGVFHGKSISVYQEIRSVMATSDIVRPVKLLTVKNLSGYLYS